LLSHRGNNNDEYHCNNEYNHDYDHNDHDDEYDHDYDHDYTIHTLLWPGMQCNYVTGCSLGIEVFCCAN